MIISNKREVFIFPGVGSFGTEFKPLVSNIEAYHNTYILQYSNRNSAFDSDSCSFAELAESCLSQIKRLSLDCESIIFLGHSFGAYVAYATAYLMKEIGVNVKKSN